MPIEQNSALGFFWNNYIDELEKIVSDLEVSAKLKECEDKREKVFNTAWKLCHTLKETTQLLTRRSGVPYKAS